MLHRTKTYQRFLNKWLDSQQGILGSKTEPYYEDEFETIPKYKYYEVVNELPYRTNSKMKLNL